MKSILIKNLKVLFVEDEDIIREKTVSSLKFIVNEVKEASNGEEALKVLESFHPDLLITDIEMPKLNGIELIKKIRKTNKELCIIVLTAFTSEKYLIQLIDMHIEKYIVKPITLEKMINALQTIENKFYEFKEDKNTFNLPKGYIYNQKSKVLQHEDKQISLTKKEISFLELLFKNGERITSYEELQRVVWYDTIMTDNALRSLIRNLRKKLPKDFIQNLSGIGYKLV